MRKKMFGKNVLRNVQPGKKSPGILPRIMADIMPSNVSTVAMRLSKGAGTKRHINMRISERQLKVVHKANLKATAITSRSDLLSLVYNAPLKPQNTYKENRAQPGLISAMYGNGFNISGPAKTLSRLKG